MKNGYYLWKNGLKCAMEYGVDFRQTPPNHSFHNIGKALNLVDLNGYRVRTLKEKDHE